MIDNIYTYIYDIYVIYVYTCIIYIIYVYMS